MARRTSARDVQDFVDAQDIDHLVVDKRSVKRATPAKGRRRNRRYQNRLLNANLTIDWQDRDDTEFWQE